MVLGGGREGKGVGGWGVGAANRNSFSFIRGNLRVRNCKGNNGKFRAPFRGPRRCEDYRVGGKGVVCGRVENGFQFGHKECPRPGLSGAHPSDKGAPLLTFRYCYYRSVRTRGDGELPRHPTPRNENIFPGSKGQISFALKARFFVCITIYVETIENSNVTHDRNIMRN